MLFFWPRGNVELGGGGGEGVVSLKQNDSTHMYQHCANPVPPTIETFPRQISFLTRRARTNFRDTNSANGEKSSATSSQWSYFDWHDDFMMQPHQKKCANISTWPYSTEKIICNIEKRTNSFWRGVQNLQNHEGVFNLWSTGIHTLPRTYNNLKLKIFSTYLRLWCHW